VAERVLIAGCGDVGNRLGRRLLEAGHEVWGLRRNVARLAPGLQPVEADLADPASLAALPRDLTLVAYTAAADGRSESDYQTAYVQGLSNLLATLDEQGQRPRRVIFTSSTGVYGQDDGSWVDETSPTEPTSFTGRAMLDAERVLAESPFPGTAVRLGGIYGPGRTRLVDQVRRGEAVCPAGGPLYTNRIHSVDAGGILAHLLAMDDPEPVYLGVDGDPADLCEVLTFLAHELGMPAPRKGTSTRRAGSKRCSNRRILGAGYGFVYPSFREGYRGMLAG
jgi:nucleoside-diphosphate-sugar epimerase